MVFNETREMNIKAIVSLMRELGVSSLKASDASGSVELVLGSQPKTQAFVDGPVAPVASVFADTSGAGVCACGHDWWIEHDKEHGCLRGCALETCLSGTTQSEQT